MCIAGLVLTNLKSSLSLPPPSSVPPVFTVSPPNITDIVLSTVHLSCSSRAWPAPDITWLKNGTEVHSSEELTISAVKGERLTVSTLIIGELRLENAGDYSCNASNELVVGETVISSEGSVTVLCEL